MIQARCWACLCISNMILPLVYDCGKREDIEEGINELEESAMLNAILRDRARCIVIISQSEL